MKKIFLKYGSLIFIAAFVGCAGDNLNDQASISNLTSLKENPLLLHPLTSSVFPGKNTMSTLYGNDLALNYRNSHSGSDFPSGSVLYHVTWRQIPDPVWFGGKIPGEIISVEKVSFEQNSKPTYSLYSGSKMEIQKLSEDSAGRLMFISSQKISVSP